MLNETLIHFFRESDNRNGTSVNFSGSASRCQLCQVEDHIVVAYPKRDDMWPKCNKCGGRYKVEN